MLSDSLIEPVCLHSLLFLLCFFASSPRLPTLLAACREKTSQRATTPPNDRTDISIYLSIYLCCRFCAFSISVLLRILYKTFLDPDSNSYLKRHSNAYAQQGHLLTKTTSLSSIRRYFFASLPLLRSLYVVGFARFRYQFYYGFYIKLFSTQIRIPT